MSSIREENSPFFESLVPKQSLLDRMLSFRMTVAYLFINVHGCEEDSTENPWKGKNGVMRKIKNAMNVHGGSDISGILEEILECKKLGIRYDGDGERKNCGRKRALDSKSVKAQIAVDAIESGSSVRIAWNVVNQHRKIEKKIL